jgi:hypothetical protein
MARNPPTRRLAVIRTFWHLKPGNVNDTRTSHRGQYFNFSNELKTTVLWPNSREHKLGASSKYGMPNSFSAGND